MLTLSRHATWPDRPPQPLGLATQLPHLSRQGIGSCQHGLDNGAGVDGVDGVVDSVDLALELGAPGLEVPAGREGDE